MRSSRLTQPDTAETKFDATPVHQSVSPAHLPLSFLSPLSYLNSSHLPHRTPWPMGGAAGQAVVPAPLRPGRSRSSPGRSSQAAVPGPARPGRSSSSAGRRARARASTQELVAFQTETRTHAGASEHHVHAGADGVQAEHRAHAGAGGVPGRPAPRAFQAAERRAPSCPPFTTRCRATPRACWPTHKSALARPGRASPRSRPMPRTRPSAKRSTAS
jgi:hypothetical protein